MLFKFWLIYIVVFFGIFIGVFLLLTLIENFRRVKNPQPKRFPSISLIVPAYNEEKNIEKSIIALSKLDYPSDKMEILVIDDGSRDRTFEIAKRTAARIKNVAIKVFTKKNGGKASAINLGISKSKAEVIATLDADSFVTKDALLKMIGYMEDEKVVSVTSSLKVYNPKSFFQKIQHIEYLFSIFMRKIFAFLNVIHITPGPLSIYRKSFFDKYGGFDEDNPTEDTEIAFRIQSHNYKIENSVDAIVYTVAPSNFNALLKQRVRWYSGLLKNLKMYPQLFNPSYGYLSLFALPAALLSVALLLVVVVYFTYILLNAWLDTIIYWNSVNFDFITLMRGFKLEYLYYELTSPVSILLLISLLFNLAFIISAKFLSKDKNPMAIGYLYYTAAYAYLYSFWWIMVLIYKTFGGKIHWAEVKFK
jgi:cellulose synthase/poly-beta-1,6-N-acetylglucosamine synthase-like glycosyltransferase